MMRPPERFLKKLKQYDSDLRVVWSINKECWLIERKIRRAKPCLDYQFVDPDAQRRAMDGYIHVGNVDPRMLDERVLVTLWHNDMWAHGGAKAVNAELDAYYESKKTLEDKTQRDDLRQVAADMWDHLAWRRRGRVNVPTQVGGASG